ncbi:MAG: hypothetical protein ABI591_30000 [Kofleriaceae bacterium]
MFLILMVVGLAGLAVMALPALGRHGSVGNGAHALHAGHAAAAGKIIVHSHTMAITKFVPSPRLVLSLLALYGAFANVLVAAHLPTWSAALLAIVPAALLERFAIAPLWRSVFQLELQASAPLGEIVMSEATAVTPFRGGRGVVSVVREGRLVQFSARLIDAHANVPVRVGDQLRIEDVEPARERVTVSVVGSST